MDKLLETLVKAGVEFRIENGADGVRVAVNTAPSCVPVSMLFTGSGAAGNALKFLAEKANQHWLKREQIAADSQAAADGAKRAADAKNAKEQAEKAEARRKAAKLHLIAVEAAKAKGLSEGQEGFPVPSDVARGGLRALEPSGV